VNQIRCHTVSIRHNLAESIGSDLIVSLQKMLVYHRQLLFLLVEQVVDVIDVADQFFIFFIDHAI